jgi:hypothetical protein
MGEERLGALNALLFHMTFWHLDISYFDRYPLGPWPQSHVGVVLWSLSASANDWLPREILARLCTVPINGILDAKWDFGSGATDFRILRPLVWFGLLECQTEGSPISAVTEKRLYRKAPLFDRFLKFDVQIERPGTRH